MNEQEALETGALQYRMPRYRCHKEVYALKIEGVCPQNVDGTTDLLVSDGFRPRIVSAEWMQRHLPEVGGYLVEYDDGYTSYSPAKAFEEGYTRV